MLSRPGKKASTSVLKRRAASCSHQENHRHDGVVVRHALLHLATCMARRESASMDIGLAQRHAVKLMPSAAWSTREKTRARKKKQRDVAL